MIKATGQVQANPAVSPFFYARLPYLLVEYKKSFFVFVFSGHIELNMKDDSAVIEFTITPLKIGSAVFPTLRLFYLKHEGGWRVWRTFFVRLDVFLDK